MVFAMKCLKKSQIKRENKVRHVMNERQILTQVVHPFIVKMQWAFQSEHYLFMVLEFCPGGEIFYHMNKVQRFSEKVAKFYFAEIVLAIEYLHNNNIFYRDLKPENILLDEDGHVKLADFGISRINFSERDRSTSFCGSPEYMSPEMLKQGRVHGRCVDFYALGALLYEMLTGLPPHFSENRDEMYRRILHNAVEYPRYLSPMAKSMLKALMVKNPDQRLGAHFGIKELKDHPFCREIDWDAVIEKRCIPPIKPSLRYSNFDPEYTSMPVRFTFEEDLVRNQFTRRKSDPGMDNYFNQALYNHSNHGPSFPAPLEHQPNFTPFTQAIVYPNFAFERRGESQIKGSQQSFAKMKVGQLDMIDDQSPNYSRPPSSTFRGYSFMNFRNDSISSGENQMTFSDASQQASIEKSNRNSGPLQQQIANQAVVLLGGKTQNSNINIIEDYQFTSSQRSRTISFANQSILTEGIEQKNIYQMDFQGFNPFFNEICFKSNEFEFNAYNHSFPKKWQLQNMIVNKPKNHQSFLGMQSSNNSSPYITGKSHLDNEHKTKNQITNQLQEQALLNSAMNNFEYGGKGLTDPQSIWGGSAVNFKKMSSILEDAENEGVLQESQLYPSVGMFQGSGDEEGGDGEGEDGNSPQTLKQKQKNDMFIGKVASRLIQDKNKALDKYGKNLIKYHDVINHVFTERKRKNNPTKDLQNLNTDLNRKGAQSLFTNQIPLPEATTNQERMRVESNYTTRSGGVLNIADTSQDRNSKSPSKSKKASSKGRNYSKYSNSKGGANKNLTPQQKQPTLKSLVVSTPKIQNEKQNSQQMSLLQAKHQRLGSSILLSPKATSIKFQQSESSKQSANKSIIASPQVTSTKIVSVKSSEEKKSQPSKFQEKTSKSKTNLPGTKDSKDQGLLGNKSRNLNPIQHSQNSIQPNSTIEKKFTSTQLKPGQLEQIDEFIPMDQKSVINVEAGLAKTHTQMPPNESKQTTSGGNKEFRPPTKKLSRLNSPKMDIDTPKNSKNQQQPNQNQVVTNKAVQLRNRVKTNSQYSTTQPHPSEFKQLMGLAEVAKNTRKDQSPEKRGSRNRIPKSQEREIKSNSDNTMDDGDENMEEFKNGENQNRQKLKNPSLMTSIALNSTKHKANAKDFNTLLVQGTVSASSSLISHTQCSSQQTPDEMKLDRDPELKASPQQLLGQASSFLDHKQSRDQNATRAHKQSISILSGQSQNLTQLQSKGKSSMNASKHPEEESQVKQAHQHSKSGLSKNSGPNAASQIQTPSHHSVFSQSLISQQNQLHQRIDSPKLVSKGSYNKGNGARGPNRHSLWSSKRSDQKTPINNGDKNKNALQIIDQLEDFEEIKANERVVTEVQYSQNEEKMLLSSSEKKLKKGDGVQTGGGMSFGHKQVPLRLTISSANDKL